MALGELIRSVEVEYRAARQREAEFERLVQEKKAQLQEQAKRTAFKREVNAAAAVRSAELAASARATEKEVQLRRESFRHYQLEIDALNVKIQLQEEQNAKDEERKLAERGELEKKLEANVDKYQAFPEAQKLANLELERNLLQKVTKLGKMKASNLEQGVGHGQGAFESTPETSTQKYQDFCTRFAEKSLTDGSPKIQHMETEAEDHQHIADENTSPPVVEEEVSELVKEASAPAEFAPNQSPTMNEDQNEVSEAEQEMQIDQVHTAPLDVDPEPVAEEPEQIEQVQEVAEAVEQETTEVPQEEKQTLNQNNFNFTRPSSQNLAPSVKLPPAKIPIVDNFAAVFEKTPPVVRSNVPTVLKEISFELPTSTSRLKEPETVKEVPKEKPKEKAFGGFGSLFGSASPTRSEASVESEDEGFGFGAFGKPKKKAGDKSEEKKNQGNAFGFGKQDDKKDKKKPSFFLDF